MSQFSWFCDRFGHFFLIFQNQKSLIFIERVVVFEVFVVFTCDVTFVVFLWPLGASWGSLGRLLEASWRHLGASAGVLVRKVKIR